MKKKNDFNLLYNNVEEIIPNISFRYYLNNKNKVIMKIGFDPTSSKLHFGHFILLKKIKEFNQLGFKFILIIGDFTATIGDPSGRTSSRICIGEKDIIENYFYYKKQIYKVLNPFSVVILFNSVWINKLGVNGIIKLSSLFTIARIIKRDDFYKRYLNNIPISVNEFLYPMLQGYDSLKLRSDFEIGGIDQKFNFLISRNLQKKKYVKPQVIIMLPLLLGVDGINKMSKSLYNTIDILDTAENIFGKIMSISDTLMWNYFDLLSSRDFNQIKIFINMCINGYNPMLIKLELAFELVEKFYSLDVAYFEKNKFLSRFSNKNFVNLEFVEINISCLNKTEISLIELILHLDIKKSFSEILKFISYGSIKFKEKKIIKTDFVFFVGDKGIFKIGKKYYRNIIII